MPETLQTYRKWLLPISYLYGMGVRIRNLLFDLNILKSKSYDLPIICVGNLAVGGTGKTPHIEQIIRILQKEGLHIAMLSRGYKRKTSGFVIANADSTAHDIGDEPYQMLRKFPDITIAVDAHRRHGIEQLLKQQSPKIDVILLDDAYQHRYVKAGMNILLTDYNHLFTDDLLLPAGNLREPIVEKERAHIVIVSKCPANTKPIDFNITGKKLNLYPYQRLFFSGIRYGDLQPLYPQQAAPRQLSSLSRDEQILLLTGIANAESMVNQLNSLSPTVQHLAYPDHYSYKKKDIQLVEQTFRKMSGEKKIIITTEKDAARLVGKTQMAEALQPYVYVLPIEPEILQNQTEIFNHQIISYVRTNKRNC